MAAEFLDIPGNIKQISLPFKLDPSSSINTTAITTKNNLGAGSDRIATVNTKEMHPQVFSFRPGTAAFSPANNFGFLHVAPQTLYNSYNSYGDRDEVQCDFDVANTDISLSSIFGPDQEIRNQANIAAYDDRMFSPQLQGILNSTPFVQVREYLQDAKLTHVLTLMQNITAGWQTSTTMHNADGTLSDFGKRIWHSAQAITMNIKKVITASVLENLETNLAEAFTDSSGSSEYAQYILRVPYILYYRLLSSTTTNIYEFPYNGKILDTSDGHTGYSAKGLNGLMTKGESYLGTLLNFIGANIRVNTTPTWDGTNQSTPLDIKLDVQLFNDTADAAVKNFILVNTLIPGNKWMQYHVYQHAPNLYDLRIDGVNRLFMCTGRFDVEQKGVLRAPSQMILDMLYRCMTDGIAFRETEQILKSIRIPDVYELHLTFTSLLPNNFNNYLYRYYKNTSVIDHPVREESVFNPIGRRLSQIICDVYNSDDILAADTAEDRAKVVDDAINQEK